MSKSLRHASRRRLGAVLAAFAVTATGCATVVPGTPSSASPTSAPVSLDAFVRAGAQSTLAQTTADLSLSGTIAVSGQNVALHGTGEDDLAHHAMTLSARMSIEGHHLDMTEILLGDQLYLSVNVDGDTLKQVTGYDWATIPVPGGISTSGAGFEDPMQILSLATQQGSNVTSLGTKTIGGLKTLGFSVATPRSIFVAQAEQRLAALTLPAEQKAALLHTIQTMQPPTYDVWFDQTQHLLRRMSVQLSMSIASGVSGSAKLSFDVTHYGVPVSITAPPASDTGPLTAITGH